MTGIDREGPRQADLLWERLGPTLHARYGFVRWLGAGAHGDVCEAIQQSTGQQVAIKLLRACGQPTVQTRFVREMQTCAALRHPNIVRVLDAGCVQGAQRDDRAPLFTVFEYVPGETLEQLLASEGTLTVASAISLMVQVLDGLQAAHELGVVHRDLKPTNIMVTRTSAGLRAKILDFGVAGVMASEREAAALTQTGESVGTPAYCAPEQLQGEPPHPGMDFYAWGLVFAECLTGQRVFLGHTLAEILHAQLSPAPVPLPPALAGHRLGALLRWVLEKTPARRIPEVRSLARELSQLDCSALVDRSGFLRAGETYTHSGVAPTTELGANAPPLDQRRFATALCYRIELLEPLPVALEESYDEWLSDTRNQVVEVCRRYSGTLAGSTASELTFYFGLAPGGGASVLRAVRGALELRDMGLRSVGGAREGGPRIGVRMGLHHGRVTINTQMRDGSPTPGALSLRAAQLCAACAPGEIAISHEVFAAARESVQVSDAARPDGAYILLSSEMPESGAPAHRLVGRTRELEELRRAWDDPQVQLVALCGAPGMGKSHLALAWNQVDAQAPSLLRVGRCLPGRHGSALSPVVELLRSRFPERSADTGAAIGAILRAAGFDSRPALGLIAALMGLGSTPEIDIALSPKKRRELLLDALAALLNGMDREPALYVFEDLHWADSATLELLQRLCASPKSSRKLLLVCTLRTSVFPEVERIYEAAHREGLNALLTSPHVRRLELEGLGDDEARELLAHVGDGKGALAALMPEVIKRAAGVPLFLVELARAESRALKMVPASTAEVLELRIDQLGSAKPTAQLVALIGAPVSAAFLAALSCDAESLLGDLSYLARAGILAQAEDGSYDFAHALLRDCAYQTLSRKDRVRLHERVALGLASQAAAGAAANPWLLATHCQGAGQTGLALQHAEHAATAALMQFANVEALGYAQAAIDPVSGWLCDLPDPDERAAAELRLLGIATTALMQTRGWADPELDRVCERALRLFRVTPLAATLPLRYALALLHFNRGYQPESGQEDGLRFVEELVQAARECEAPAFARLGLLMLGAWHLFHGSFQLAASVLRGVDRGDAKDAWLYGFDAYINSRSVEVLVRWSLGDPDVLSFSEATLQLAADCNHPATEAMAQLYHASLRQLMNDRDGARTSCLRVLAICARHDVQGPQSYATIILGWADNDPERADGALRTQIAAGQRLSQAYYEAMIAEAELGAGRIARAKERLARIEPIAERSEQFCLPLIVYLQAVAVRRHDLETSDALIMKAFAAAQRLGSPGMTVALTDRFVAQLGDSPDSQRALRDKLHALSSGVSIPERSACFDHLDEDAAAVPA